MRVERLSQRAAGRTAKQILLRDAWKLALALGIVGLLLTSRGAEQVQPNPRALANNVLPTNVPCGTIPTDAGDPTTATWTATSSPYGTGSPYILPVNAANNLDTTVTPCAGITVPQGVTLKIDASNGPVDIFSHGAGIIVQGGQLLANGVLNPNGSVNAVSFDAEPDVASWDGIVIHGAGAGPTGDASFIYSSVQHALTAITIDGGATSSPDNSKYGLTLRNSGVVNSYFDGIEATNTPVSLTGQRDGRFGTVNNIGSFGVKVTFDRNAPAPPENALKVDGMTFGSSVPFAETACAPLSPCAAGTIGNDAIQGMFAEGLSQRPSITNSDFFRAGNFGVELTNPNDPIVSSNTFDCNGTGSPDPKHTCTSSVATKSSPIYLNNATADLQTNVNQNFGKEDGLEAIVFNGKVTSSTFTWKTATLDATKELGYVLNGDLDMSGGTFIVRSAAIIKVKGGALNLSGTTLDASDTTIPGTAGAKILTSLRDNSVGVPAGCSVFVQACTPPLPLPPGDWGGINLVGPGANGAITNASVEYATTGIQILNGQTSTLGSTSFGLLVRGSNIGPTFADGIDATDTPVSVATTTFACPTAACANSSAIRNHGIVADFTGTGPVGGGLKLDTNIFNGTGNEGILGLALSGQTVNGQAVGPQTVSVTGNTISNAGAHGIKLDRASNPIVKGNTVNTSGTGSPTYPAIYLPDLTKGDFVNNIAGNLGAGNGLDALAFHGDTNSNLTWQTIGAGNALGYLVDGNLTVNGTLTLNPNDYVPVLGGAITVKGHPMVADGAVVSSLREQVLHIPSCGSVFVPKRTDGTCQAKAAGDWNGIVLTPGQANVVMNSEIRYATTGITVSAPNTATTSLTLTNTNVRNSSGDGVSTGSTLAISKGAFTNLGGHGIVADLTGDGGTATATIDQATVGVTGAEGILITGDAGHVGVTNTAVDKAGAFGIHLKNTINPAVSANRVTNTAAGYPAIYLDAIDQADFTTASGIRGNTGGLNPVNALAMHGNVKGGLSWITARTTADPTKPLGFILDGNLNLTDSTLTLRAGDVVKISNGGITLAGGRLDASDTSNSSQKIFTSLQDTAIGVPCPLHLASVDCSGSGARGQWNGIKLTSSATHADGTLINAAIRYATNGIDIDSGASSTVDSSVYGLMVSRSSISSGAVDGISAHKTAISVTDSTVNDVHGHGISVDLTGADPGTPLRLSGNRLMSTSAEGILGQALAGQPVWIADNHIVGATTFGIRLMNADELVLRNNNVSGSGNGLGGPYPAVYLSNVVADFSRNVRGNVGQGDGLNAIALDGTLMGDLNWLTPVAPITTATKPLGYLLDGSLLLDGGNLNVGTGGVVKALGGSITLKGGKVAAAGAAFTSLRDESNLYFASCPSYFSQSCVPHPGDWGGLVITDSTSSKGTGFLDSTTINWADTGIAIDSGPIGAAPEVAAFSGYPGFRLVVQNHSVISNANKDGINALDTPISVDTSTVSSVGRYGVIASLISPANCASTTQVECSRLTVTGNTITTTVRDGIVANGITDQHVDVSDNTVTGAGTYGIHLAGADLDSEVSENTVTGSGLAGPHYPAMYLSSVDGDFNPAGTVFGNRGLGNGMDALVFHGIAENSLTWVTPGSIAPTVPNPIPLLGYMLDGDLTVNGNFTATGVVKILGGSIKVNGALNSIGTVFTSMDETGAPLACPSVFVPVCPNSPTSWGGINVDATASSLSGGAIRNADQGLQISGAPLNVSGVHVSNLNGDAFTVTDSAETSSFNDMTIDQVNGNGVNLENSDATFARDVITNITGNGNYAIVSSGGTAAISCSDFHGNANGLSLAGPSTVDDSNAYGNTGVDLIGTSGTPVATSVWYGVPSNYTTGKVTGVTVRNLLPSEAPVATLDISGTDPTATDTPALRALSSGATGTGTITATVTLNRAPDTSVNPDVSYTAGGTDVVHHVTSDVGGAWTGSTWTSNAYAINSSTAMAGLNHFTVDKARDCIPDGSNTISTVTTDVSLATNPTVVTASSPLSATYGGSTTLSATLTSNSVGIPTETVQFAIVNGSNAVVATALGVTDGSGVATTAPIDLAGLNVASYGVTAVFKGDNTYAPSLPDTSETLTIGKVPTLVTSSSSPNATDAGGSVSDLAAINGVGSTASGTVTYNLYDSATCTTVPVFTNTTSAFTDGNVPSSSAWTAAVGTYNWRATYSGDSNHQGPTTSACNVDKVVVAPATPALSTTPSAGGTVGGTISDVANLTGGVSPIGGDVTFSLYAPGDTTCSTDLVSGTSTFQGVPVVSGSATSPNYTTTQAGTFRWIAQYGGDGTNAPVSGGCGAETVTVAQATPTLNTVPSASGAVGTAITDTANLTAGYNPTGSVSFSLYAPGDTTCATDLLATSTTFHSIPLSSSSATSPAYTTLHAGDYRWVATYSGDANNTAVTGGCSDEKVTITQATPTLSTVESASGEVGTPITDTAIISKGANPSGTVSFKIYGPNDATCAGSDLLATDGTFHNIALVNGSASTPDFTPQAAGSYRWIATYNGDTDNAAVSTHCGDEVVTSDKAIPTLSTAASAGGTVGGTIHDTANLTNGYNPGGDVNFELYAPGDTTCATDLVATNPSFKNIALASGSAGSPNYTTTLAGDYRWVVDYLGDSNNLSVSSGCGDELVPVAKVSPTIATAVQPASPVVTGTPVKDQATLSGTTPDAGGDVTYNLYSGTTCIGTPAFTNAQTVTAASVPPSASFPAQPQGSYTWQAVYSGDSNNNAAVSTCGSDALTVINALPSVTMVTPSSGPAAGGTAVTITGTHLNYATDVKFGTVSASPFTVVSDTQITVTSPNGVAGTVDITVTTPSGTSAVSAADQFTYGP